MAERSPRCAICGKFVANLRAMARPIDSYCGGLTIDEVLGDCATHGTVGADCADGEGWCWEDFNWPDEAAYA